MGAKAEEGADTEEEEEEKIAAHKRKRAGTHKKIEDPVSSRGDGSREAGVDAMKIRPGMERKEMEDCRDGAEEREDVKGRSQMQLRRRAVISLGGKNKGKKRERRWR